MNNGTTSDNCAQSADTTAASPCRHGHGHHDETPHDVNKPVGEEILTLSHVCIGWDNKDVLHDINFTVRRGDFITITGPNGGGKTTLLRIILGLLAPTSGRIVRHLGDMRVGYLPQKNMIDSSFPITVREVIESGLLAVRGLASAARRKAYQRAIGLVALEEHQEKSIGVLSGGQLQRTLLARAIIAEPGLLVLDEPLSYIDNRFEARLYDIIEELSHNTTIILVSHQMTTLAGMSTRHFIIDHTLHECPAHHHYFRTECE